MNRKAGQEAQQLTETPKGHNPQWFGPGSVVLVSLNVPREKFWGGILDLALAGVSLRGIDLNSFEDFARQVKTGEPATPNVVFFPMHRVERIELDARNGEIPSLQERFFTKTGKHFAELLRALHSGGIAAESGA